jgi:hypothetical protein
MFSVVSNIHCESDRSFNQERINQALYNLYTELPNFDFYIYDEERYHGDVEVNVYDASMVYPRDMNPTEICWRLENGTVVYNPLAQSYTPISELHFVLTELLAPREIVSNGYAVLINENIPEVNYYIVSNNHIYRHINKSLNGTKFYEEILKMYNNSDNKDPEFDEAVKATFTQEEISYHLSENDSTGILKALVPKL